MKTMPPNKSPQATRDGVSSLRSQRRHETVAQQETFASRTGVAVAVHGWGRLQRLGMAQLATLGGRAPL